VKWIAFPLHPETPEEGRTLERLFAGRSIDIRSMLDHLARVAADCGLQFGTRTNTYNSRRAQELGKWAESLGKGDEFHMAVFKSYFADGLNIAKIPVLVELAESVGLEGQRVEEVLSKGIFKEAVDHDWRYSRACRITAVPTFSANGRMVVGAQPYKVLVELIKPKRTDNGKL
jgi:predicted DsbA family dithiol-disulfide isomerase